MQKVKKMLCGSRRRMRLTGLTLLVIGLLGFVYVDGLPMRKSLKNVPDLPREQQQQGIDKPAVLLEPNNKLKPDVPDAAKMQQANQVVDQKPLQGVNPPQVDVNPLRRGPPPLAPDSMVQGGKLPSVDVKAVAQGNLPGVQELPAQAQVQVPVGDGAHPDNAVAGAGQEHGEMLGAGAGPQDQQQQLAKPDEQQPGQPALAKVPQHREQQLDQPQPENIPKNLDDLHPIKKAVFQDTHQTLKVKDLKPPDHLDAVRMEQDGHLNRDYKKEIFLGNHEEIEQGTEEQIKEKLKDIFQKVDTNSDGLISASELEAWIILKVEEHFKEAIQENEHVFKALDTDNDGDITWREFHIQFLMAKGHDQKKAEQHMEDYETIPLEPDDKEQLIRFKFRWAEADEDPQDNKLTEVEFRNFRHPEQSENMLLRMVQDIVENLDKDHDGIVTQEEFAALPPGEVDEQWKESDRLWQEERRKEFKDVIDLNKDGQVSKEELKRYVDPKNPQHSKLEAQNLIELADSNKDGKVSLAEMLDNTELFLGSKVVNTGRSFHDEF